MKRCLLFVPAFAVVFFSMAPSHAVSRRVHSSACHYHYDYAGTSIYNGAYLRNVGTTRSIYCYVPSDSLLPHNAVRILNVHGYEPPRRNNLSRACAKLYNLAGTQCGPSRGWSSGYVGVYGVSTWAWSIQPAGMPYLLNYLASGAQLYGFYVTN